MIHGLPMPVHLVGRVPEAVTLTTPVGRGRRLAGIRLLGAPLATDQIMWDLEVPVTTPARTAVDIALASGAGSADALAVVDAVLNRGLAGRAELSRVAAGLQMRPGCARARRLIDRADANAESPLESHSRLFFLDAGIPMPESQVRVHDDRGLIGRVDFLWRDRHTIGEADGRLKYLDPDVLYREKRREDRLRDLGFEVVRWDFSDLRRSPGATAARIRAAFDRGYRRDISGSGLLSAIKEPNRAGQIWR